MKKVYEKPEIEVIHFDYEDIVTCSNGCSPITPVGPGHEPGHDPLPGPHPGPGPNPGPGPGHHHGRP